MKNWQKCIIIIFLALAGMLQSCQITQEPILLQETVDADLPDFLSTIEQYNDHPFYVATYKGDYVFDAYLESGVYPDLQSYAVDEPAYACSCFYANGEEPIFGRNFDWYDNPSLLLFTDPPDAYQSVSMVDISYLGYDRMITPLDDPEDLRYAPYYPFDGMNEHGLTVGMMAVGHAEGGKDPDKVTLGSLELIRLMLDHARDVPDVLELVSNYNVDFGSVPVHYLIADRSGNSAVIEFLDDEMKIISGSGSFQVSTNFIISEIQLSGEDAPCTRYNKINRALEKRKGVVSVSEALSLLKDVSQASGETATRWSIVYDMKHQTVNVVINRNFQRPYSFAFE